MPAARRQVHGARALVLSLIGRIASQFAVLPILFAHWEPGRVGAWLALFAIPSWLAVFGASLSSAGGAAATRAAAAGDRPAARTILRASWLAASAIGLAALGAALAAGPLAGPGLARALAVPGDVAVAPVLAALGVYVFALGQMHALSLGFQAAGRYPLHTNLVTGVTLIEIAVLAACVALTPSLAALALALAATRLVAAAAGAALLLRLAPDLVRGRIGALGPALRALALPTAALIAVPLAYAVNLQGYALLIGASYGGAVLAGFVTTRTLTRAADLATGLLYNFQFFEAAYVGDGENGVRRRQLAALTGLSLIVALGTAALVLGAGPWLQAALSVGKSRFDYATALVLLVSGTVRALATTPTALLVAQGRLGAVTAGYLAAMLAACALSAALAAAGLPLWAVLLPLVPAELAATVPAFARALAVVGWRGRDLARALVARERLRDLAAMRAMLPF